MVQWSRRGPRGRRRKFLDLPGSKPGEVLDGALEGAERSSARLVRDGNRDLGSTGQHLEKRPLGRGQILEAVCEDRLPAPGVEIAPKALDGCSPDEVPVPEPESVELRPVCVHEPGEVPVETIRIEESRVELAERGEQGLGEAACGRGRAEARELTRGDRAPHRERALDLGRDPRSSGFTGDGLEQVVERADAPREKRRPTPDQIVLDSLDVEAIGYDEPRISIEHVEIALEEQRDLAGVRRPDDEREAHFVIVVPALDALSYAVGRLCAKCAELGTGPDPTGLNPSSDSSLGPATPTSHRLARHFRGAAVAEIGLLRTAAGVREIETHHGASALGHFARALVAHEDRLSRHVSLPVFAFRRCEA